MPLAFHFKELFLGNTYIQWNGVEIGCFCSQLKDNAHQHLQSSPVNTIHKDDRSFIHHAFWLPAVVLHETPRLAVSSCFQPSG